MSVTKEKRRAIASEGDALRRVSVRQSHAQMGMYSAKQWSENKVSQRAFVLSEFRRLFGYRECLKLLSLPGECWDFERDFVDAFPNSTVVGVEGNRRSFEVGLRRLDGDFQRLDFTISHREVECFKSGLFWSFNAHLDQILFGKALKRNGRAMGGMLSGFKAIWLDLNSPLGHQKTLDYVHACTKRICRPYSVLAVSYVVGRDSKELSPLIQACPGETAIQRRQNFLRWMVGKHLGIRVMSASSHQYKSANTRSSLTIGTTCLFLKRSNKSRSQLRRKQVGDLNVGDGESKGGSLREIVRQVTEAPKGVHVARDDWRGSEGSVGHATDAFGTDAATDGKLPRGTEAAS